jgi:hypothetical protein
LERELTVRCFMYLAYSESNSSWGSVDTPNTSWELEDATSMQRIDEYEGKGKDTDQWVVLICHIATAEKQERGWEEEEAERQAVLKA